MVVSLCGGAGELKGARPTHVQKRGVQLRCLQGEVDKSRGHALERVAREAASTLKSGSVRPSGDRWTEGKRGPTYCRVPGESDIA